MEEKIEELRLCHGQSKCGTCKKRIESCSLVKRIVLTDKVIDYHRGECFEKREDGREDNKNV